MFDESTDELPARLKRQALIARHNLTPEQIKKMVDKSTPEANDIHIWTPTEVQRMMHLDSELHKDEMRAAIQEELNEP